jgi:hypothetical protein
MTPMNAEHNGIRIYAIRCTVPAVANLGQLSQRSKKEQTSAVSWLNRTRHKI